MATTARTTTRSTRPDARRGYGRPMNSAMPSSPRGGGSVYLGADTGLGPMYLGVTYAPRGELGIALFIGRP